jgi:hypothetical protein
MTRKHSEELDQTSLDEQVARWLSPEIVEAINNITLEEWQQLVVSKQALRLFATEEEIIIDIHVKVPKTRKNMVLLMALMGVMGSMFWSAVTWIPQHWPVIERFVASICPSS